MIHTVSSIRAFRKCQRFYQNSYVHLARPVSQARALLMGSATHDGIDVVWAGLRPQAASKDPYFATDDGRIELARVQGMLNAYYERWHVEQGGWELVATELEFIIKLGGHTVAGKIDKIARFDGRLYLVEHKSTSSDVETVGDDYWQRIALDTQVSIYEEAVLQKFGERPGTLYDVVKKPGGEPKLKEAIRRRKDETDADLEARKASVRESLEEFTQRMTTTMLEAPDEYLVRRVVSRTREQQHDLIAEAVETMLAIEASKSYPRNDMACTMFGKACSYLGVCTGTDTLDGPRFVRVPGPHAELSQSVSGEVNPKESANGSSTSIPPGLSIECPV